jgi:membrane-bound serine protease (ClpP class)
VSAVWRRSTEWRHVAHWLAMGLLVGHLSIGYSADTVAPAAGPATLVELQGAIGPAMSRYIEQSLLEAEDQHSPVVILEMDTPGGLDTSMRDIIKAILASTVPVVTYVAPGGARAASAGTYILYASHVAAMAPATNLGAATPISIGGEAPNASPEPAAAPEPESPPAASQPHGSSSAAPSATPSGTAKHPAPAPPPATTPTSAGERKAVNDAVAYIRALAQLRGRNADWAESAVRGAASLSSQDALAQHVIELIARDVPDLLQQLDGRSVEIAQHQILLHTKDVAVRRVAPDWRARLLMFLTHPTIAYGLLLIGIYGLLLEGYNPGAVLPGVVGALSLILALYALELLAVSYAGLALIVLGTGLIVLEFFMPAFGSLGIGGLTAFVIGSIILFDNPAQGLRMALPVIVGLAVSGALVIGVIAWLAARARRQPITTGAEAMIGGLVDVVAAGTGQCVVRYGGELWNAQAAAPLHTGQQARIVKVDGLTLWVEPQQNQ